MEKCENCKYWDMANEYADGECRSPEGLSHLEPKETYINHECDNGEYRPKDTEEAQG